MPSGTTPAALRDRAILELFYSTGLRRMELLQLEIDDVDLARGTVLIRNGKGGKDRLVPIGEQACVTLDRYLTDGRPELVRIPGLQLMFLGKRGQALSPAWISETVGRYVRKLKDGRPGACHLLRHSMATSMLENGADIRYIQAMLGHAQLSTTQIYTQVAMHQLRKVHQATHPTGRKLPRPGRPPKKPASHLHKTVSALIAQLPATATLSDLEALLRARSGDSPS